MAIDYERVNWDTTKFVNPSNMNQMDLGIKNACDGVDALEVSTGEIEEEITAINTKLDKLNKSVGFDVVTDGTYGIASTSITASNKIIKSIKCDNTAVYAQSWVTGTGVIGMTFKLNSNASLLSTRVTGTIYYDEI